MSELAARMRHLPSVNGVLDWPQTGLLIDQFGRELVVEAVQAAISAERDAIRHEPMHKVSDAGLFSRVEQYLHDLINPTLFPVINATGVIIHTNLGRAPLSQAAIEAITATAAGYSNLEFDLESGKRGSRSVHAATLLTRLTGAEAATVANNTAAGVVLMLSALCQGREVIISRGQLVEIGGGFRVPDVMAQSGCKLVEVGTTNRTHLRDYANAITEETAAILVAHHSNFKIIGFTTEPTLGELAQLAHERGILLLYDQGSGALLDTARYGLEQEPLVQDGIAAGADLIAFSGDKLLGGPQAGILAGKKPVVDKVKRHPLARAVRPDKTCLAALSATLSSYVRGTAAVEIPIWQMMALSMAEIEQRAARISAELNRSGLQTSVIDGYSTVGGGSLPGQQLPTKLVAIDIHPLDAFARRLRLGSTKVVGRIQNDQFLIDPRTLRPHQITPLIETILNNLAPGEYTVD